MKWLVALLEWWLPTDGTPDPGAAGGSPHGAPGRGGGEGFPSNVPCARCGVYRIAYVTVDGRSGWCASCVDPAAMVDAGARGGVR